MEWLVKNGKQTREKVLGAMLRRRPGGYLGHKSLRASRQIDGQDWKSVGIPLAIQRGHSGRM